MTRVLDLVLRAEPKGGDVQDPVLYERGQRLHHNPLAGASRLILFVHGFNVDLVDAADSYAVLQGRLADAAPAGRDWAFGTPVVRVFWPGDADWGWFSALVYPQAIGKANDTGRRLAAWLAAQAPGGLTVDWLCHSMGNRVALAAMQALGGQAGVRVGRCLHLAAAVSTWQLEDPGQAMHAGLQRALADAQASGARDAAVTSVHSVSDMVLALAFPVGETLQASTQGVFPMALGHEHWRGGDALAPHFGQLARDHLGHGDYWGGLEVGTVHAALQLPLRQARATDARATPMATGLQAPATARRELPARELGAAA